MTRPRSGLQTGESRVRHPGRHQAASPRVRLPGRESRTRQEPREPFQRVTSDGCRARSPCTGARLPRVTSKRASPWEPRRAHPLVRNTPSTGRVATAHHPGRGPAKHLGMGRAGGVGAHGGPTGRSGGGSRSARLGAGSLASPGARKRQRAPGAPAHRPQVKTPGLVAPALLSQVKRRAAKHWCPASPPRWTASPPARAPHGTTAGRRHHRPPRPSRRAVSPQ